MKRILSAMLVSALLVCCLAAKDPSPQQSAPRLGWCVMAKVIDVHDGDSITVDVTYRMNVRLAVWCPELKRPVLDKNGRAIINLKTGRQEFEDNPSGLKARDNATAMANGKVGVLHIPIDKNNDISKVFTFGRAVGDIYIDGKSVSDDQIRKRLGAKTKAGQLKLFPHQGVEPDEE